MSNTTSKTQEEFQSKNWNALSPEEQESKKIEYRKHMLASNFNHAREAASMEFLYGRNNLLK